VTELAEVRTLCGTVHVVEVPEVVELRVRLNEAVARQRFADHVELQRQIGRVHVRRLLDEFARSVGAPTRGDDRRAAARQRLIERQHPDHPEFIGRWS